MKKLLTIVALSMCALTGCSKDNGKLLDVDGYTTAYITSEVQEYTHDLRMAHCENDIYIEVPYGYSKDKVNVEYTGKFVYYWVEDSDVKVSNKGFELEVIDGRKFN